jgi:hypothetical protein
LHGFLPIRTLDRKKDWICLEAIMKNPTEKSNFLFSAWDKDLGLGDLAKHPTGVSSFHAQWKKEECLSRVSFLTAK